MTKREKYFEASTAKFTNKCMELTSTLMHVMATVLCEIALSWRTRRGSQNGRWKVRGIIAYTGWID